MNEENLVPSAHSTLVGDAIYLRVATADDIRLAHGWLLESDPQSVSCRPVTVLTPEEAAEKFKAAAKSSSQETFMVVRSVDDVPVGRIRFFDLNPRNLSAEIGLLIAPQERRKRYAEEAVELLCRYLFQDRGLNKVHAQTAAYNKGACRLLEKIGFKKDGTLRRHYFWHGIFHDGFVYSLLRDELKISQ